MYDAFYYFLYYSRYTFKNQDECTTKLQCAASAAFQNAVQQRELDASCNVQHVGRENFKIIETNLFWINYFYFRVRADDCYKLTH